MLGFLIQWIGVLEINDSTFATTNVLHNQRNIILKCLIKLTPVTGNLSNFDISWKEYSVADKIKKIVLKNQRLDSTDIVIKKKFYLNNQRINSADIVERAEIQRIVMQSDLYNVLNLKRVEVKLVRKL